MSVRGPDMTAYNINKPICACSVAALPQNVLMSQTALWATLTFEELLMNRDSTNGVKAVYWLVKLEACSSEELLMLNGTPSY